MLIFTSDHTERDPYPLADPRIEEILRSIEIFMILGFFLDSSTYPTAVRNLIIFLAFFDPEILFFFYNIK